MTALALLVFALSGPVPTGVPTQWTVHLDRIGHRVSPDLFGVFFEEINHAGDGGIYGELIRNRDFAEVDQARPVAWRFNSGTAKIELVPPRVGEGVQRHAIKVTGLGDRVELANAGFWGLSVRRGATYKFSIVAKREGTLGSTLDVSIQSARGDVLAEKTVRGIATDWTEFTCELRAKSTDPAAKLVIGTVGKGTLWIDYASLFPRETWRERPAGLRRDLASLVDGIQPAFLRFPGGCYVEGNHLENAFRWKSTVVDPSRRPGHMNDNWGYRSTDGLGYHEYLQMCEDVGARGLYVANCGMSHHEIVPMDQLQPWIQDCLDAIEYANGPVESPWGAVRAKNGHPAPFGLKFVEIGNENGMFGDFGGGLDVYEEHYKAFFAAIKAKYPDIVTVADTSVHAPMELVDEHYYQSPDWFWSNVHRYDSRPRTGAKVYVGEYAVTQNCGQGNLRAALAEAAFMTGLERNSDVVAMASYAPLFTNSNDRRWNPDAIVFDASRSFGTPSYWVQRIFGQNRASKALDSEVSETTEPMIGGGVGVGTWKTQAEYKDLVVERDGQPIYRADFGSSTKGWDLGQGKWTVVDGALRQSSADDDRRAVVANPLLDPAGSYRIRVKARKLSGDEGFLLMFKVHGSDSFCWWNVGGWGNHETGIEESLGGGKVEIGERVSGQVETGRWYDLEVRLDGPRIRTYLDGKLVQDVVDRGVPSIAADAGLSNDGDVVLKVVNRSERPNPVSIQLDGSGALLPTAGLIVLTSGSMDDENSLDRPTRISPKTTTFVGVSRSFTYEAPARSLSVLRIRKRG